LIEAVIFDLDGTLINLPVNYEKLIEEIENITKAEYVGPLTVAVSKLDEKIKREVFKVWDEAELEALEKMTINDKGMAIYRRFSEKPKALVTMQGKALVKAAFERLKLSFNMVLTREDSLDRVEQLRQAMQSFRTPAGKILFVGNTKGDLQAAKYAECQFRSVRQRLSAAKSMEISGQNS
jgi:phosphoglycolate phosphatase-like HAD superfamily hydrolase